MSRHLSVTYRVKSFVMHVAKGSPSLVVADAVELLSLPGELIRLILSHCAPVLTHVGAACRQLEGLTNEVARERCHVAVKGFWAKTWRMQLQGRVYHRCLRIRNHFGSAGTRAAVKQPRIFSTPCAVCALSHDTVAVACSGDRAVIIFELPSCALIQRLSIDGVPTGVSQVCVGQATHLAVTVQGCDEAGEPLAGVSDTSDRLEVYSLGAEWGAKEAKGRIGRWRTSWVAPLWYPNGLTVAWPAAPTLFVANWNHNCVVGIDAAQVLRGPSEPHYWCNVKMEARGAGTTPVALERPSDVAWLDFGSTSGARPAGEPWSEPAWHQAGLLAVAEYFGGVHLYAHPGPLHSKRTMTPAAAGTGSCAPATPPLRMLDYVLCLRPSRNGRRAFERPSALGVDRSGQAAHPERLRLLVAETGAMLVSVFEVSRTRMPSSVPGWHTHAAHLCDICVEQLGTGVLAPARGCWGWLGLTVTPAGDVVVADADNGCLYLV